MKSVKSVICKNGTVSESNLFFEACDDRRVNIQPSLKTSKSYNMRRLPIGPWYRRVQDISQSVDAELPTNPGIANFAVTDNNRSEAARPLTTAEAELSTRTKCKSVSGRIVTTPSAVTTPRAKTAEAQLSTCTESHSARIVTTSRAKTADLATRSRCRSGSLRTVTTPGTKTTPRAKTAETDGDSRTKCRSGSGRTTPRDETHLANVDTQPNNQAGFDRLVVTPQCISAKGKSGSGRIINTSRMDMDEAGDCGEGNQLSPVEI